MYDTLKIDGPMLIKLLNKTAIYKPMAADMLRLSKLQIQTLQGIVIADPQTIYMQPLTGCLLPHLSRSLFHYSQIPKTRWLRAS